MKRTVLFTLFAALSVWATAQTDRVTRLQNARQLQMAKTDGTIGYHEVTTDHTLMLHKKGNRLVVGADTTAIADIKYMRLVLPQKFALNEDSTTFTSYAVDHGLLAFRYDMQVNKWNTLILPFELTGQQLTEAFGEGTQLAAYENITEGSVAQVNFTLVDLNTPQTVISPAVFYLIRPTRQPDIAVGKSTSVVYGSAKIPGPVYLIPNVTMTTVNDNPYTQLMRSENDSLRVRIYGSYKQSNVRLTSHPTFLLNEQGTFEQLTETTTMKGFRNWVVEARNNNNLPYRFYINGIGEDITATGIEQPVVAKQCGNDCVYDLSGRPVGKIPTRKGLYIVNGKKMIVR